MERLFTNKSLWKKIVIILLCIMAFQYIVCVPVNADEEDYGVEEGDNLGWGGVLLKPVMSLFVTIGDGIVNIMHSAIMGVNASLLHIDLKEGDILWQILKIVIAAVVLAVAAVALVATFGGSAVLTGAILAVVGGTAIGVPVVAAIGETVNGFASTVASTITGDYTPNDIYLPIYTYTPEEIFKGNILLFNVNFFDSSKEIMICYRTKNKKTQQTNVGSTGGTSTVTTREEYEIGDEDLYASYDDYINNNLGTDRNDIEVKYYYYEKDGEKIKTSPQDSAVILKKIVSRWYIIIRNICIVGMLSVLIYVGIRILLSSAASDKAKYKEMIKDWLVGLSLLFIMHYIMSFSVTLVEKITDLIGASVNNNIYTVLLYSPNDGNPENDLDPKKIDNFKKGIEEAGLAEISEDEEGNIIWPTNLMGYLRLKMQFDKAAGQYIGEAVCFFTLVVFPTMFTFTYFRRLLYMAFLTMIAPFVALTYCIDKINDGKAQGFNKWLREYIFNLLIQPLHLLLYYVLVTSAFELAGTNVIYSLVALGFMIPAEKLLRSMFGFEKATTPSLLGGPLGATLMMQGFNKFSGMAGRNRIAGGNGSGKAREALSKGNKDAENNNSNNIRESFFNTAQEGASDDDDRALGAGSEPGDDADDETRGTSNDTSSHEIETGGHSDLQPRMNGESEENFRIREANYQASLERRRQEQEEARQQAASQEGQQSQQQGADNIRRANINPITHRRDGTSRKLTRRIGSMGAASKVALKNAPKKLKDAAFKGAKTTAKGVAKGAFRGAIAAGGAAVGAAVGIATGDPSKAIAAVGAGASAGYSLGKNIDSGISSFHLSPETKEAYESYRKEKYGDDDKRDKIEEDRKNAITKMKLEQALEGDKDTANRYLQKGGEYERLRELGVNDEKDVMAGLKMLSSDDQLTVEDVARTIGLNDAFGRKDPSKDGKVKQNMENFMTNGIRNNNSEINEEQAKKAAKRAVGNVSRFNQFRDSIK